MSEKICRSKGEKCSKCKKESVMEITNLDSKNMQYLCENHYISHAGNIKLKKELEEIERQKDYKFWDPKIALLIFEKFPYIAKNHKETLKKIKQQKLT